MKIGPRLSTMIGAALLLAGGSLAMVAAQPAESPPPATATEAPPEEAPPASVDTPAPGAMNPIPDSSQGPLSAGGPVTPNSPQVRLELPPLRIIEQGQPIPLPPRTRAPFAIIEALDKVTAQSIRFAAPVGQPVRYENLIFTVRACEATSTETSQPEAAAFLEILSQPPQREGVTTPPARQVFRGWMFASSPALHPLEHPVYDAWVIACSTSAPHA
jgi:hypothetical protein